MDEANKGKLRWVDANGGTYIGKAATGSSQGTIEDWICVPLITRDPCFENGTRGAQVMLAYFFGGEKSRISNGSYLESGTHKASRNIGAIRVGGESPTCGDVEFNRRDSSFLGKKLPDGKTLGDYL